jgi:hypothetical protein
MNLKLIELVVTYRNDVDQDRDHWRLLVNLEMNFRVPQIVAKILENPRQ